MAERPELLIAGASAADAARDPEDRALVERRMQALIETTADIIWRTSADGEIDQPMPSWERFTGQSWREYRGRGWIEAVHPDDRARVDQVWRTAVASRSRYVCDYRLRRADGEWRDTVARGTPLLADDGSVFEWIGANSDVTDMRQAIAGLHENEARLRLVQAAGGIGSFDWDIASGRIHRSPEYLALHGLPPNTPLDGRYSDAWRDRLHPEDREQVERWFQHDLANPGPFEREYRIRRADTGETRWILNRGVIEADAAGKPVRLLSAQTDITELKRASERLRESEERFRRIADSAPVLMWVTATNRKRSFANQAYVDFLGLPYEEAIEFDWRTVLHPDDHDRIVAASIAGEASLEPFTLEARYRRCDGQYRWIKSVSQPRWGPGGEFAGFIGVGDDITEAKKAEVALRDSEAQIRLIADSLPVLISFVDRDGRYRFVNAAYQDWVGMPRAEILGRTIPEVIGEDSWRTLKPYVDRALAGERITVETAVPYRDGGTRHVRIDYVPAPADARVGGYYALILDQSEAKRAELALLEKRRTLETLNRTGAALASELDLERVVQMVTDAGVELTGAAFGAFFYNVLDEAGESYMLYTLSGADRSAFEKFPMPRNTAVFGPTFRGEGVMRSDDIISDARYGRNAPNRGMPEGHLPVRSYLAVPVAAHSGEVIGGLFFGHPETGRFDERHERLLVGLAGQAAIAMDNARLFREAQAELAERRRAEQRLKELNETLEARVAEEIGERMKAEETLRQAQKMEAIGQLTGGIAHDFNNLLTVIMSSVDLLKRPGVDPGKQARYIDAIGETASRAAALTNQLLAFARRQPLASEAFDVGRRLKGMEPMLRTVLGAKVELGIDARAGAGLVEADPNQFDTAILNMVVNARDAMPEGGSLTIAAASDGEWIDVGVTDTGSGIAPEAIGSIFEPFYTTKGVGKGTGLGLSQVYGFARQSGGEVSVTSELGKGSRFVLRLPRSRRDAPAAEGKAADPEASASIARILVVEDNRDVGEAAVRLLEDLGHQAVLVRDAAEALDRVLKRGEAFDLVFSDVIMPGPIDGLGLARLLREQRPELPVVLTTGYSHSLAEDAAHGFELLRKPYRADALMRVIARAVSALDGANG